MFFLFFLALLPYFFEPSTGAVLPRDPSLPPLITLEEHFISPALEPEVANQPLFFRQRLPDLDDVRLQEMDEGQIVKQ